MRTKLWSIVAVVAVLVVGGVGYGYQRSAAKADCCFEGSPCCELNMPCCTDPSATCCFEGSPCCYEGSACCAVNENRATTVADKASRLAPAKVKKSSCCGPNAACCEAGEPCCTK
jgi:hypothetical protein